MDILNHPGLVFSVSNFTVEAIGYYLMITAVVISLGWVLVSLVNKNRRY